MKNIKKIICVLLLIAVNLFAQEKDLKDIYTNFTTAINSLLLTKKGTMEVSGFLSYNYITTDYIGSLESRQSIMQIEPQISYFFMDNISVGLILSYAHSQTKNEFQPFPGAATQSQTMTMEQALTGPLLKMYFGEDELRPFVFTNYLFWLGDSEASEADVGAGIFYHVSGNFGINLYAKYGIIWQDDDNIDSQQRIFLGLGITNFIL